MSELPEGWIWATLEEVCSKVQDGTHFSPKQQSNSGAYKYITAKNIKIQGINLREITYVSEEVHREIYNRCNPKKGDVLYIKDGATTGIATVNTLDEEFSLLSSVALLKPNWGCLDSHFLKWYLNSPAGYKAMTDQMTGSAITRIILKKIRASPIPLAPLNEQRRIVAKLEKLLSRVDAAQVRLATIPRILKQFRQSVLAAACSGRLTADWRSVNPKVESPSASIERLKATPAGAKVRRGVPERVQLSDLVADWELPETWRVYSTAELLRCGAFVDVKDGNHGANHPKVSEFTESGLPFITAAQVNNYRIDYDSAYKLSGKPLSRIRVGFAKSGDVIYTHKGSVGRVAVADRHCVLTPQTTYYRVNPDVFLNQFVMFYLASNAISEQVNVVKEQTTRDFVPISEQYLLFDRVPPLAEQQEIVRRVEALFKTADALEARYRKAKAHVDKLTQSILAKAFRGELVPQDPNDEPASILLERIRKHRGLGNEKSESVNRRRHQTQRRL